MTILMCAQKLTDASLIYRTGPKTKTSKMKKKLKKQTDMLRRNGTGQETMESVRKREGSLGSKGFLEQEGFEPGVIVYTFIYACASPQRVPIAYCNWSSQSLHMYIQA